ncbi:GNAT family protein [Pikeienuella sp. HZG-20]|uniref:GNAT family N-acetyltransferase n=1 Tax=Paludibacillus litoralis TaxID=3133267 RepID=UPI0030EDB4A5
MFGFRRETALLTDRLVLRPPRISDYSAWATARRESRDHLKAWEPAWPDDHLSVEAFRHRVRWARKAMRLGRAWPFMLFGAEDGAFIGAITLDNVRRGPADAGTLGYWTAARHARQGYMREALTELRRFAFDDLRLGRLEAGCLPENTASRGLLEAVGFEYEGVARAYLEIDGRWRDHVLYAALREDRCPAAARP